MDKEKILESSRKENKNRDLVGLEGKLPHEPDILPDVSELLSVCCSHWLFVC